MEGRKLKNEKMNLKTEWIRPAFMDFQFLWNIHQMVPRVSEDLIPHIDQLFKQGFVYCESFYIVKMNSEAKPRFFSLFFQ